MQFTDSHCHIDFPELSGDTTKLLTLLQRCKASEIDKIVVPAVSPLYWQRLLSICSTPENPIKLLPCIGIHPWYLKGLTPNDLASLASTIQHSREQLVAIGETGIDGVIAKEQNNLEQQIEFFQSHIDLANLHNLPLIVHHRRSHQEVTQMLKRTPVMNGGIIHAFSGSYQQGKSYIDLGFKLGIGGTITYPRAKKTIKAVKRFPLDALVLETDAPAMPLFGQQGENNSPLNLIAVFEQLCSIREESKDSIAVAIEKNVSQLFNL